VPILEFDSEYVVVGSGAGGGTVAARLAEGGRTVVVLEAGGDPRSLRGGDPVDPSGERLPDDYDVPAFHAFASENEAVGWHYFVRHYADDARQKLDPKYRAEWEGRPVDGVLYPRAGTLGGCTAHNALIFVYPHDEDWDAIAELTGDPSWGAEPMRRLFNRLEDCRHRLPYRWLARLGIDPTRHGWRGWLRTEKAIPISAFRADLAHLVLEAAHEALDEMGHPAEEALSIVRGQLDPNDRRSVPRGAEGIWYTPLTTRNHSRAGTRERLLDVQARHPDRLRIVLDALATRIELDERGRATGVRFLKGEGLYRAHRRPGEAAEPGLARASREVVVAGGAFNTPQLLMLSGIGPAEELRRHGIPVRVDLSGVGRNLQDRYEVGVVSRMNFAEWSAFEGARFRHGDLPYRTWEEERGGVYSTNGVALAMGRRSSPDLKVPDLFLLGLLGRFEGYHPGYSADFARRRNYLTWVILKAHTHNTAGEVRLRSPDPRDPPIVNFRYFEEGTDDGGADLSAVVKGIRLARRMNARVALHGVVEEEELPGAALESDEALAEFVRRQAWGHHASCTCAIGPAERGGVLDGGLRVHGTSRLRVADASVFPHIPGFFLVSAVYMVGEKAAASILAGD